MIETVMTNDNNEVLVSSHCPWCRENWQIIVNKEGFEKWKAGELIQRALPLSSVDDRELLMSGICNTCWDEME